MPQATDTRQHNGAALRVEDWIVTKRIVETVVAMYWLRSIFDLTATEVRISFEL
jgi:hypothetical protein